jgi:hypothetical protein
VKNILENNSKIFAAVGIIKRILLAQNQQYYFNFSLNKKVFMPSLQEECRERGG